MNNVKELTNEEWGIISIVRLNKEQEVIQVKRSFKIGRFKITYNRRSKKNLWGRFGGGWNWEAGFQLGSSTLIINLFIASIRIDKIDD